MAGVAQLVRALGCGSRGRGFDPRRLPHLIFLRSRATLEKFTSRSPSGQRLVAHISLLLGNPAKQFKHVMDILFFAAVAFFIFWKLSKQLGKVDEDERKQIEAKVAQRKEEIAAIQGQIIQKITEISAEQNQAEEKILAPLDVATRENLSNILSRCNLSAEFFVNGAKSAFEMILKAFSTADIETLKTLLSENIYKGFEGAINARRSQEQTLVTNLISIEKTEILSAALVGDIASVVIKFTSKQINYISDKNDQIVEGKKDEISELSDVWTFRKDVTSLNPNWLVSNTAH